MERTKRRITVSAPGKVLLAGGYLVLESPNVGCVVAVDKRFYCTAAVEYCSGDNRGESDNHAVDITVHSPQYQQTYHYKYSTQSHVLVDSSCSKNEFLHKTLQVALMYFFLFTISNEKTIHSLDITIRADNEFYSLIPYLQQRNLPCTLESVLEVQEHPIVLTTATKSADDVAATSATVIHKTGLGSSACLVTSLVGALAHLVLEPNTDNNNIIITITNLAQISHCYAQGKVGSGFDVSAACHGSHVYQRFPVTSVLQELMIALDQHYSCCCNQHENQDPCNTTTTTTATCQRIKALLQTTVQPSSSSSPWSNSVIRPLQISNIIQIMLADVSGGSESPSMARKVLQWKNNEHSSSSNNIPHWSDLIQINSDIVELLENIARLVVSEEEKQALTCCRDDPDWMVQPSGSVFMQLRKQFQLARFHLKAMGEAAGVPIEPPEQTMLADATLQVPGVIAAVVPGAGGFDALACLYINHPTVRRAIANMWASWEQHEVKVCPLAAQAIPYGDGVRIEA